MNVLVLCTGNSARSILLEVLLRDLSGGRIKSWSAGSHPAGRVHPQSLSLLTTRGHDVTALRSKSWDEFGLADAPVMDAVITVCGSAAAETCPFWPGAPVRAHWGAEDPAAASADNQPAAFAAVYDLMKRRSEALLALPFETLTFADRKRALDQIGLVD